jgi:multiple antibiotic resistance protein
MLPIHTALLSAFITLLVTIGPVETAGIFGLLTSGVHRPGRRRLARRAVAIAGVVLVAFAVAGGTILSLLHISIAAFRTAGGALLFLQAITLIFSNPGLSSLSEFEKDEAKRPGDIAVFPLAFPLIAGPGSLLAVVLIMSQAGGSVALSAAVLVVLFLCLGLTYCALIMVDTLDRLLGVTGTDVIGRLSGLLLAGLAVQFMFDGITGWLKPLL